MPAAAVTARPLPRNALALALALAAALTAAAALASATPDTSRPIAAGAHTGDDLCGLHCY